jgi:hypothetical protein
MLGVFESDPKLIGNLKSGVSMGIGEDMHIFIA